MDAGKASSVGAGSMTPSSTPVRRTANTLEGKYRPEVRSTQNDGNKDADTVELSSQGKLMADLMARQNRAAEGRAEQGATDPEGKASQKLDPVQRDKILADQQKLLQELRKKEEDALKGKGELTDYEKNRMARLDQIQLMIDQGKYQVDNFIVDRVAVDLAKLMV